MDNFLTVDGLVRFRDKIYVPDNGEQKKVILSNFRVKPYSSHSGYQKKLTTMKKFYYCSNMKKDVVEFVARFLDCPQVKVEHRNPCRML